MRSTFTIALIVLFAANVAAQDEKKYESKAGKYIVVFPGTPTTSSTKTPSKSGDIEVNVATVAKGGGGFFVIYSDLSAESVKATKSADLLDGGEKGLIDNLKAKVTSSKNVEFGKPKYPGRQIVAEVTDSAIHLRLTLILVENRLYQVLVFGSKDLVNGKEADKFFESFEVAK